MFQAWWKIRKATWAARKCERQYDVLLRKANESGKSKDDIHSLECEASHFVREAWIEQDHIVTHCLLREAELLNLPVPDSEDRQMWHHDDMAYDGMSSLTNEGITRLRKAIREERKARGMYAKIVFTAIVSSIGAIATIITALVAFLNMRK